MYPTGRTCKLNRYEEGYGGLFMPEHSVPPLVKSVHREIQKETGYVISLEVSWLRLPLEEKQYPSPQPDSSQVSVIVQPSLR